MYQLTFKKSALKALRKMAKPIAGRMMETLNEIARSPYTYQGDWKKMQGAPYWRLRLGNYRAICNVEDGRMVLLVVKIGARGDVYK